MQDLLTFLDRFIIIIFNLLLIPIIFKLIKQFLQVCPDPIFYAYSFFCCTFMPTNIKILISRVVQIEIMYLHVLYVYFILGAVHQL